jgi:hypothetical protein
MHFGPDADAFSDAIDTLQLDALIHDPHHPAAIHNLVASESPGITHHMGRQARAASTIPLVETVKALQIAALTRENRTISTPVTMSARVLVSHQEHGQTLLSKPVAVLGVSAKNEPSVMSRDGEYGSSDLAEFDEDPIKPAEYGQRFENLTRAVTSTGDSLVTPWYGYYIAIGAATTRLFDIDSVRAHDWHDMTAL